MDIKVLDHIILSSDGCYSFTDEGTFQQIDKTLKLHLFIVYFCNYQLFNLKNIMKNQIQKYILDPNYTCNLALSSNNSKTLEKSHFTLFIFFINKKTGCQDKVMSMSNKFNTNLIFKEEPHSDIMQFNEGWEKYEIKKIN